MNGIIVITPEDLEHLITKAVKNALMEINAQSAKSTKEVNEILSAKEAAEYLRIPQATLYFYTCKRLITFFKKGKRVYFHKVDLNEWIKTGRREILKTY